MSTEILRAKVGMSIEDVLKLLVNSKITGLPVVNKQGKMVGIVSEYDIIRQISQEKNIRSEIFQQPIDYQKKVEAIGEKTPLDEIIQCFIDKKYRRLPVVDDEGKLSGIITRRDLMKLFYYRAKLT